MSELINIAELWIKYQIIIEAIGAVIGIIFFIWIVNDIRRDKK